MFDSDSSVLSSTHPGSLVHRRADRRFIFVESALDRARVNNKCANIGKINVQTCRHLCEKRRPLIVSDVAEKGLRAAEHLPAETRQMFQIRGRNAMLSIKGST